LDIEASNLIIPGKGVRENALIKVKGRGSLYFETIMSPGFADAHAHPQVIDAGLNGQLWRNSIEWIKHRKLQVDEAALRKDTVLSKRLAEVVLMKSALNGVTLIALVGSYKANFDAAVSLPYRPRAVIMPTVMTRNGWLYGRKMKLHLEKVRMLFNDGVMKPGVFVHSIHFANRSDITLAYELSERLGIPFGIHLSEGTKDSEKLMRILDRVTQKVVAVHCINEDCKKLGFNVVACPESNITLYGKTVRDLSRIDAFGSDWPLILGTLGEQYRKLTRYYYDDDNPLKVLEKATLGGYAVYDVPRTGDIVCYDESPEKVLRGEAKPRHVFVNSKVVVEEGTIGGLTIREVEKMADELSKTALEKYPLQRG